MKASSNLVKYTKVSSRLQYYGDDSFEIGSVYTGLRKTRKGELIEYPGCSILQGLTWKVEGEWGDDWFTEKKETTGGEIYCNRR